MAITTSMTNAARVSVAAGPLIAQLRRHASQSAATRSPDIKMAIGTPNSTAKCNGRLWAWGGFSADLGKNGVSESAKLNSPKPTPRNGLMAINSRVWRQTIRRMAVESPPAEPSRSTAVNATSLYSAQPFTPSHARPYKTGEAINKTRAERVRRLSSAPHAASKNTPIVPVREPERTTANMNNTISSHALARPRCPYGD